MLGRGDNSHMRRNGAENAHTAAHSVATGITMAIFCAPSLKAWATTCSASSKDGFVITVGGTERRLKKSWTRVPGYPRSTMSAQTVT